MKQLIPLILLTFFLSSCSNTAKEDAVSKTSSEETISSVKNLQEDEIVYESEEKDEKQQRRILLTSSGSDKSKLSLPDFDIYINQKDVSIEALIRSLGVIANMEIYVAKEVSGYTSISVDRAKWLDVFNYILSENELVAEVSKDASSITVKNKTSLHNDVLVTKLLGRDFALVKEQDYEYSIPEARMEVFELYHVDPETVKTELDQLLGYDETTSNIRVSGVKQTNGARVNEFSSNADGVTESYSEKAQALQKNSGLIITATTAELDRIEKIIDSLDKRIPQVFIEAFILTVTDDFERALGSRLSLADTAENSTTEGSLGTTFSADSTDTTDNNNALTNFAITGLTATSGFNVLTTVGVDRLRLGLEAMERDGLSRTVANPKIMVINQEKGYFFQGSVLCWSFTAGGSSTTTDGGTTNAVDAENITHCTDGTTSNPDYPAPTGKEIGLKLEVVPSISLSNEIMLDVNVQQTSATATSSSTPPTTSKLSLTNRLLTNSGDIIVIGGNHSLSESFVRRNIPGLGGNSFTGALAGGNEQDDEFKEMLIFLSARKM